MTLEKLGWNAFFAGHAQELLQDGCVPARVGIQHRSHYVLHTERGEWKGEVSGKLHYLARGPQDLPAVGDWVMVRERPGEAAATIVEILPRKTRFSRRAAGTREEEQVVAANIDVAVIVSGLDHNFNLRRIERYLVLATESGARPVLVLNKADICANVEECTGAVQEIARGASVLVMSALYDEGIGALSEFLPEGVTGALLGSSGVGKSTIINHLLGEEYLATAEVRESDSRGRHATAHREMVFLPSGGLIIDTPGMRELQLWGGEEGLTSTFADIEELAGECKFRDCTHLHEPGCAVQAAIAAGTLDEARFQSYQKLLREIAFQNRRKDPAQQQVEKERVKKIMVQYKKHKKNKKR